MAIPKGNVVRNTGISYIDGLLQGGKWVPVSGNSLTLSYSFWNESSATGARWNNTEKQLVRDALNDISSSVNIKFIETSPSGKVENNSSDISFSFDTSYIGIEGLSFFPDPAFVNATLAEIGISRSSYPTAEGDVIFNPYATGWLNGLNKGGDGYWTIIHEIAHALGLKHPFDDGGGISRKTFSELGISKYDRNDYTVMSYEPRIVSDTAGQPATLTPFDIAALQHIYGANNTYNTGATNYVFSNNSQMKTIWDAGGADTIDGSALTAATTINLTQGERSTVGSFTMLSIAYNTVIESARTGTNNDTITGNDANNIIIANLGSDIVNGGAGNDSIIGGAAVVSTNDSADTLYGGLGSDTIIANAGDDFVTGGRATIDAEDGADVIYGGIGSDSIFANAGADSVYGGTGRDLIYGGIGNDVLFGGNASIDPFDEGDSIYGGNDNDSLYGNGGNDYLSGDTGNDVIYGGAGNDYIISGAGYDSIYGGEGADTFYYASVDGTLDVIMDFTIGTDIIRVSPNITNVATILASAFEYNQSVFISLGSDSPSNIAIANITLSQLSSRDFLML